MQLNTIPRTTVKATLLGLRLPLCGVEVLTGQTGNASWPPAMAYEGFEAGVKQVVGSILHDEELVDEGRIQQAKVTELRRAVELEVRADQKRAAGDRELRERQARAQDERDKAEQDALRREQVIERDRARCRAASGAGARQESCGDRGNHPATGQTRHRCGTRSRSHASRPGVNRPQTATTRSPGQKSSRRRQRRTRAEEGRAPGQEVGLSSPPFSER